MPAERSQVRQSATASVLRVVSAVRRPAHSNASLALPRAAGVGTAGRPGCTTVATASGRGKLTSAELSEDRSFVVLILVIALSRSKTIGVTGPPDGAQEDCPAGLGGGQATGVLKYDIRKEIECGPSNRAQAGLKPSAHDVINCLPPATGGADCPPARRRVSRLKTRTGVDRQNQAQIEGSQIGSWNSMAEDCRWN